MAEEVVIEWEVDPSAFAKFIISGFGMFYGTHPQYGRLASFLSKHIDEIAEVYIDLQKEADEIIDDIEGGDE